MLRRYSDKTISCYRARLAHYRHWCHTRGYQTGTIRQTINALVFWAERSTGQAPDDRAAKQALRGFTETFNRTHPPAWRVAGRRSPRRRRATVPRPLGDGGERP
ncbi:hypothetical protein [Amycolatopsis sp. lyj-90]|uniref:hypothetical protein n=1 Tax=Amycolatopsis sp. lyj-90 TaxID=2789285 RepID=UPI00397E5BAA